MLKFSAIRFRSVKQINTLLVPEVCEKLTFLLLDANNFIYIQFCDRLRVYTLFFGSFEYKFTAISSV